MSRPRGSGGARDLPRRAMLTPYRALRARYNAALLTLYERTALPVDDIAGIAGVTVRVVQMMLCELGARARHAKSCRPGVKLRLQRGPRPRRPGKAAARRAVTAFRAVARLLRAEALARRRREFERAVIRARRAADRALRRSQLTTAHSVRYLATTVEGCVLMQRDIQARRELEPTPEETAALREELERRIRNLIAENEPSAPRPKPRRLPTLRRPRRRSTSLPPSSASTKPRETPQRDRGGYDRRHNGRAAHPVGQRPADHQVVD